MDIHKRRNYFIDKPFQTIFIIKFCVIAAVSSGLIGALIYFQSGNFTTVTIENTHVMVKRTSDFILPIIYETLALVMTFSAISVIFLTLYTSHRIAGPLFRLRREIEAFKSGDLKVTFKIRKTDQFHGLAAALFEMSESYRTRCRDLKVKAAELHDYLKDPNIDRNTVAAKIDELERMLNYFKT